MEQKPKRNELAARIQNEDLQPKGLTIPHRLEKITGRSHDGKSVTFLRVSEHLMRGEPHMAQKLLDAMMTIPEVRREVDDPIGIGIPEPHDDGYLHALGWNSHVRIDHGASLLVMGSTKTAIPGQSADEL
jgi:hypothetical protein